MNDSTLRVSLRFPPGTGTVESKCDPELFVEPTPWGAAIEGHLPASVTMQVGAGRDAEVRAESPEVRLTAEVATDSQLCWMGGPGAIDGDRSARTLLRLSSDARLLWIEAIEVLDGATWSSRIRVVRDGWPLLTQDMVAGPVLGMWPSAALLAGARIITTAIVVDPSLSRRDWKEVRRSAGSSRGVALPLSGPGCLLVVFGDDQQACSDLTGELLTAVPRWAAERWQRWGAGKILAPSAAVGEG